MACLMRKFKAYYISVSHRYKASCIYTCVLQAWHLVYAYWTLTYSLGILNITHTLQLLAIRIGLNLWGPRINWGQYHHWHSMWHNASCDVTFADTNCWLRLRKPELHWLRTPICMSRARRTWPIMKWYHCSLSGIFPSWTPQRSVIFQMWRAFHKGVQEKSWRPLWKGPSQYPRRKFVPIPHSEKQKHPSWALWRIDTLSFTCWPAQASVSHRNGSYALRFKLKLVYHAWCNSIFSSRQK